MIQLDRFEHVIKNADELLVGSYKHEKIISAIFKCVKLQLLQQNKRKRINIKI
jgi:hypothetical protein